MSFSLYAKVILDQQIDRTLDYGIPEELIMKIKVGQRISIPLRGKNTKATVVSLEKTSSIAKVSPIASILSEESLLTPELLALAHWMSDYYCCSLQKAISCTLPAVIKKDLQEKTQALVERNLSKPKTVSYCEEIRAKHPKQALVLDAILARDGGIFLSELLQMDQITRSPIDTLVKNKILTMRDIAIDRSELAEDDFFPTTPKMLTSEQQLTLSAVVESISKETFQPHLILGVTGSGKTEIYLQAIEKTLQMGKGVILLVPEIALTGQTIERLKGRFQEKIAVFHSRLSQGQRFDAWHKVRKGEISIVVGARSALFSPLQNLGLIIVDEEQEHSYKQLEEAPCYHARDVAVMRAKMANATVVLGSATPSLESYHNALTNKYTLHKLTARATGVKKPQVKIINMAYEKDRSKGFALFSDPLLQAIAQKMADGEQSILFLNRRGYYTCQVCTSCFKTQTCEHCDLPLTYHRGENILSCHICLFTRKPPIEACLYCGERETLKYKGPGTEQVERTLHAIFPHIRTLRMDRDTTKHKGSHEKIFQEFRSGKADLLIGTQMIAKGLHFPNVTLVGILGADSTLNVPDFRASESVFSLITQVAGRSGRGEIQGEVIIQTHLPDHPVIKLASQEDTYGFFELELKERKLFNYPPYSRLAKITFSGKDPTKVAKYAESFHALLSSQVDPTVEIYPITPCAHSKIKDHHRFQCIIKTPNILPLAKLLKSLPIKSPSTVKTLIDINPISTY